jgi:hypothetical protein
MYYQLLYLKDENEYTINEFGTKNYEFGTEFAIVLFDKFKKPFAFIGLEYTEFDKALGYNLTLTEVINKLQNYGFIKYSSNKSAKMLRKEVKGRTDISYWSVDTGEKCDFYHATKDVIYNRRVYDLKIIDNKTRKTFLVIENYDFNDSNPSLRIIANGIMKYTINYRNTKEYEEDCRIKEEELQRRLQEEERIKQQERLKAEAIALVQEQEAKRIEELIQMKIKELENQEVI